MSKLFKLTVLSLLILSIPVFAKDTMVFKTVKAHYLYEKPWYSIFKGDAGLEMKSDYYYSQENSFIDIARLSVEFKGDLLRYNDYEEPNNFSGMQFELRNKILSDCKELNISALNYIKLGKQKGMANLSKYENGKFISRIIEWSPIEAGFEFKTIIKR